MPSIKSLAFVAALATSAVAYYAPIEARSDLDFAPEDLEVLFAREAELDSFVDELELVARDLDFSPEDLEVLFARDPKFGSSLLSKGASALSRGGSSSSGSGSGRGSTLSKLAHGAERAFGIGMDAGNQYQAYKGQKLQNQQMHIQNQQMQQQGGYPGAQQQQQGGYYNRRDLFEEEDPEMWY